MHHLFRRRLSRFIVFLLPAIFLGACNNAPAPGGTEGPAALPTNTPVPTVYPDGLFVDGDYPLGPISPLLFGTNYGPWLGVSLSEQEVIKDLGISIIRFPGGNWGDTNTMTEAQIDMLMYFAEQWGADEIMIHVRLPNSSPEVAVEWILRLKEKGHPVTYWSIGNEPDLLSRNASIYPDGYPTDQFNEDWRRWALAMKEADPDILLVGPEISQLPPSPDSEYAQFYYTWLTEFLKHNGDLVDIVSVHRYPFPASRTSGPPGKEDLRPNSQEWDQILVNLRSLIQEHTGRNIPIAITETNSSYSPNTGGDATMDSHFHAIWWADVLGRMIRNDVEIVTQFAVTGQYGMIGKYRNYPTSYVYSLYKMFGSNEIYASSSENLVTVYAAQRADGALTLMVINLNSEAVNTTLALENLRAGSAQTWLLDETHSAEQVADTALGETTLLTLPPESVTLFVLPGQ